MKPSFSQYQNAVEKDTGEGAVVGIVLAFIKIQQKWASVQKFFQPVALREDFLFVNRNGILQPCNLGERLSVLDSLVLDKPASNGLRQGHFTPAVAGACRSDRAIAATALRRGAVSVACAWRRIDAHVLPSPLHSPRRYDQPSNVPKSRMTSRESDKA